MVPSIGHKVVYQGKVYHVQDRNNIAMTALIGEVDENGLVPNPFWVEWSGLSIPMASNTKTWADGQPKTS